MSDETPLVITMRSQVDAASAAVTTQTVLGEAPWAGVVTAVGLIPVSTITGANTNSRTVTVTNRKQDGTGTTNVATLALVSSVNATGDDTKTIPLNATAANLVVAAGDVISYESTAVASGLADPGGSVFITLSRS